MTKEQIIKKAWEKFEKVKYNENCGFAISYCINGVTDILEDFYGKIEFEYLEEDLIKWRPISLKGIENNNGWNTIKTIQDLPKESGTYLFTSKKQEWLNSTYDYNDVKDGPEWFLRFSHWREIVHVPNPIY